MEITITWGMVVSVLIGLPIIFYFIPGSDDWELIRFSLHIFSWGLAIGITLAKVF